MVGTTTGEVAPSSEDAVVEHCISLADGSLSFVGVLGQCSGVSYIGITECTQEWNSIGALSVAAILLHSLSLPPADDTCPEGGTKQK